MKACAKPVGNGWCPLPADHSGRCVEGIIPPPPNPDPRWCSFEGCGRKLHAATLCRGHYAMRQRGQPLRPLRPLVAGSQHISVTVSGPCADALDARGPTRVQAAREVLEEWATRKGRKA